MAGKNGPLSKKKAEETPSAALVQTRHVVAAVVGAIAAAVIGAGIATAALLPASHEADERATALEQQLEAEQAAHPEEAAYAACDHQWRTLGLFEATDEVTHTEEVPEVTEVVDIPHTLCNECFAIVDGQTVEHTAATGHTDFSTDVPVPTTIVTQEGYSTEVVDEPATQRFTPVLEWCPICGATQAAAEDADAAGSAEDGYEEGAVATDDETAALISSDDDASASTSEEQPEGAEWPEGYPYSE